MFQKPLSSILRGRFILIVHLFSHFMNLLGKKEEFSVSMYILKNYLPVHYELESYSQLSLHLESP